MSPPILQMGPQAFRTASAENNAIHLILRTCVPAVCWKYHYCYKKSLKPVRQILSDSVEYSHAQSRNDTGVLETEWQNVPQNTEQKLIDQKLDMCMTLLTLWNASETAKLFQYCTVTVLAVIITEYLSNTKSAQQTFKNASITRLNMYL